MDTKTHLGRSKHGVYYASLSKDVFRVWILDESLGQTKWMLKGELDLTRVQAIDQHVHGPWILQDINSHELFPSQLPDVNKKAIVGENSEWNSDNDFDDNEDLVGQRPHGCDILGFHPHKEILFLSSFKEHEWIATVHAYHLNNSKVQCLGNMRLKYYDLFEGVPACEHQEYQYFPYTPCWIDEVPSTQM
jgi:hypothetical protein